MNLSRGFLRLTLVLSGTVMILGIGMDSWTMPPRPTTVRITLTDGRQVTLDHMPRANSSAGKTQTADDLLKARMTEREALAFAISELPEFREASPNPRSQVVGKMEVFDAPPGFRPLPVQPRDLKEVTVVRAGMMSWWWTNRNVSTTLRHRGHAFTVEPQT